MVTPRCRGVSPSAFWTLFVLSLLSSVLDHRLEAAEPGASGQAQPLDDAPLPKGAICRIGTARFRTNSEAGAVFLPDGRTIVTTGGLWNVETGKRLGDVPFDDDRTRCIAHSRDRRTIATLGFKFDERAALVRQRVQLWNDALERKAIVEWVHGSGEPTIVAISDDERIVVVADTACVLRTFNVETATKLSEIPVPFPRGAGGRIEGLAISPDGKTLAAAGKGGVGLFDLGDLEVPPRFLASSGREVRAVAFSPDGTLLAGGDDGGVAARIWNVATSELVKTLIAPGQKHYYASTVGFTADGKRLIVPTKSATEIWNVERGELEHSLSTGHRESRTVDISPDGEWLIAGGSWDVVLSAWHLPTLRPVELPAGHLGDLMTIAFSPDGATVYTASDDGTVRSWNAATGAPLHVMPHAGWVRAMVVSPDGRQVASSSLDDTVAVWDAKTGQQIYSLFGHGKLGGHRALAYSPDSSRLYSFGDDSNLRIWDTRNGKAVAEHRLKAEDDDGGAMRMAMEFGPQITGTFSAGGSRLFLGDGRVLDTASGKPTGEFVPPNRGFHSHDRSFSPDGRLLASIVFGPAKETPLASGGSRVEGGQEPTFQILDLDKNSPRIELRLPDRATPPVAFSADGTLAAVGNGEQIHVFDCASGKQRYSVTGLPKPASRLTFSPEGTRIAAAHSDTTVTLWPLADFAVEKAPR